jgi:molecular chaperone DnaK (HSP70)
MFRRLFAKKVKTSDLYIEKIILDAEAWIESSGVLTESFGIRIYDGSIAPFAKKGEIYPASGSYTFTTTADYQDQITLEFHRSPKSKASKDSYLGTVRITGYKLRKAEEPMVRVHYSISDGKIILWATNEKENKELNVTMLKNADGNILQ